MTLNLNQQTLIDLDTANRALALAPSSFIVEAPAGAGKTELLTQRYLKLLSTVNEPEEIIALTFTNKAAAEMRNRILLSLDNTEKQTLETAPHKLKTRELANAALQQSNAQQWDILNQPSRLRILTIDALCSSLTRQMPLLSKFGGQPVVSDDTDTHYLEAARRTIAQIIDEKNSDGTVTTALRYMDNNSEKLIVLLAKMLARRDQWLPFAGHLHGLEDIDVIANTEAALKYLISENLQLALSILTPAVQNNLMSLVRYAASNVDANAAIAPLQDWQNVLSADADDLVAWQALANFLVTKSEKTYRKSLNKNNGFPATDEGKSKKEDYFNIVSTLENSQVIGDLLNLPALEVLAESQAVIKALTQLLFLGATHLWAVFQAAGEVDFVAIADSAQQALENEQGATDLALKLDYKISHLLIDEFQDTSPVQMRLIEKLIEGWQPDDGRTLFCVGDPMQSIYRFRKANVSLFLEAAQHGIGHLPLTRLQLTRNNRSHPAVVGWINNAFQQVFPNDDNINQGAISYREFTATKPPIANEGVVLHPLILAQENEEALESLNLKQIEAAYVADLIMNLRNQNGHINKTQKIAVLVRSRSHLRELVSEIRRNHAHLKFQAVEIEHLNHRQTVQDALSLTCALHHRADRTHWLNVLRAPWCGLTLADLYILAADNHRATIWQLMQDEARLKRLSDDGQLRLAHVKTVLDAAFSGQGRIPIRRWLEATWLQLGGSQCLVSAGDNRDVQVFFDLVEKVSRGGQLDIAALELGMQKLYAKPDIDADDSLQFLTIHKSKGLEFDTVILPALNRKPRSADNELVIWQEVMVQSRPHLIAAPIAPNVKASENKSSSLYKFLKDLETVRSDNEIVRLLYVAATRTERQLHMIAAIQANKNGELKPAAKSMLEVLWPAVESDFMGAEPLDLGNSSIRTMDISQFKPKLQRLNADDLSELALANDEKHHDFCHANQRQAAEIIADKQIDADFHRHCGILAHLYMELLATTDLQAWDSERLKSYEPAMKKWLMQQGHTEVLSKQGAEHVLSALQTTLTSEAGQWVLNNHMVAASELSLMECDDAQGSLTSIKNHVIDRTFIERLVDGRSLRWVIDYKLTHFNENNQSQDGAEQHQPQLTRYASLFKHEGLTIKKAVLFLSTGQLVELA